LTAFGCRTATFFRIAIAGFLLAAVGETVSPVRSLADSPITRENARPGGTDWILTDPADHEVEGYASATSIQRGDKLHFYIHSTDPRITVAIYRMGWYAGAGARLVQGGISLPGVRQPMPSADPVTGLIECDWQVSYTLNTATDDPGEWLSGVYLAKLTGTSSGK